MWGELFSIERVLSAQPFEVLFNPPLAEGEKVTKVEFGRRHAVMMTCKLLSSIKSSLLHRSQYVRRAGTRPRESLSKSTADTGRISS